MLTCPELSQIKHVKHGFFTRKGGVSADIYESLNCGPGSNDDTENITRNRDIIKSTLEAQNKTLCTLHQCHSNEVVILKDITDHDPQRPADALVTNSRDLTLGILTADCAPVLFADTKSGNIGAAHSGWKGALYGILENTIDSMLHMDSNAEDIVATIGPTIGPDSYEVGEDFRQTFVNEDADSRNFFHIIAKSGHYLFDLPGYVESRLRKLSLKKVQWIGKDTLPDEENFFSYRRSCLKNEADYGRQISAITTV